MNSDHCFCPGYQVWETRTRSDLSKTCLGRDTTLQSVRWIVIIVLTLLSGLGREDEVRFCPRLVWEGIQPNSPSVIIVLTLLSGLGREDEVRFCPRLVWEGIQHPWPVRRIVIINSLLWAGLGSEDEVRLVRDLFEKGYNPLIRPVNCNHYVILIVRFGKWGRSSTCPRLVWEGIQPIDPSSEEHQRVHWSSVQLGPLSAHQRGKYTHQSHY